MKSLVFVAIVAICATLAFGVRAEGPVLRIGSKRFTESYILAEIAAEVARAAGDGQVVHTQGLGGTAIVFRALEEGSIDVYPEYSGTIAETILEADGARKTLPELRQALFARGIGVTESLGFENTYALAVPKALARAQSLRDISNLAGHPDLRFALSHEFVGRPDGWPGLAARYGLESAHVQGMDHGLAYDALATGRVDIVDAYSTDAKLRRYDLVSLIDDRRFFPAYQAVFLYRLDVPQRFATRWARIAGLAGSIDAATMIELNGRAELDGRTFAEVAGAYVSHAKGAPQIRASWLARLATSVVRYGPRHVFLVFASLALSTLIGVALGILASRSRRFGVPVVSAVALVQTIPSLALLCFMIPLLGIGVPPTLAALFLYGLLPIVRNTFTGLATIAPQLREASVALGLSPFARLFTIELPLATRTIVAGIKTSAIINVGTATVAAFIGAGGFGEPISIGLNLNDTHTILDGAIPAALLALLVEAGFLGIERLVVPRGLRLPARA